MIIRRVHFEITDSTNARAATLLAQYPNEPLLVTAEAQSAGRGRTGRAWQSPVGGAWFTLAWPTNAPAARTSALPIATGLAVHDTITTLDWPFAADLRLKWPNDVLLDGAKVAGILCEQTVQSAIEQRTVLIGVGINANLDPRKLGDGLRQPATSLQHALGRAVDLDWLINTCAEHITSALHEMEQAGPTTRHVERINQLLAWRGQRVTLHRRDTTIEGVLRGIDAQGRAIIDETPCDAGDLVHLSPQPADH